MAIFADDHVEVDSIVSQQQLQQLPGSVRMNLTLYTVNGNLLLPLPLQKFSLRG